MRNLSIDSWEVESLKNFNIRIVPEGILNLSNLEGEKWRKENGFKTPSLSL